MAHDERLIQVAAECPEAALLWPWLITYFDDWGRAEANTLRLKARLFPMNPLVTVELLDRTLELYARVGLIILYEHGGKRYMAIPATKWYKYQTHIRKNRRPGKDKMESDYPPPPGEEQSAETPQIPAGNRGEERGPVPSTLPPFHPTPSTPPNPPTGGEAAAGVLVDEQEPIVVVATHYRERIGLLSPGMFHALDEWLDKGMAPEVLMAAIDETAAARDAGEVRRSVDGLLKSKLRDWYNLGIRTAADLQARARADPEPMDPVAAILADVDAWEQRYRGGVSGDT